MDALIGSKKDASVEPNQLLEHLTWEKVTNKSDFTPVSLKKVFKQDIRNNCFSWFAGTPGLLQNSRCLSFHHEPLCGSQKDLGIYFQTT
jgi:hypothetical protein